MQYRDINKTEELILTVERILHDWETIHPTSILKRGFETVEVCSIETGNVKYSVVGHRQTEQQSACQTWLTRVEQEILLVPQSPRELLELLK